MSDVMEAPKAMDQIGLYLMQLTATTGDAGAETLHLKLAVNAVTGAVTGAAIITQALASPVVAKVPEVTGVLHHTGLGVDERLIAVKGQYVVTVDSGIGAYLADFTASIKLDEKNQGTCNFSYNGTIVSGATVTVA